MSFYYSDEWVKVQTCNDKLVVQHERKERRVQSKSSFSSFSGFTSPVVLPTDILARGEFSSQPGFSGYKPHEMSKHHDGSRPPPNFDQFRFM